MNRPGQVPGSMWSGSLPYRVLAYLERAPDKDRQGWVMVDNDYLAQRFGVSAQAIAGATRSLEVHRHVERLREGRRILGYRLLDGSVTALHPGPQTSGERLNGQHPLAPPTPLLDDYLAASQLAAQHPQYLSFTPDALAEEGLALKRALEAL